MRGNQPSSSEPESTKDIENALLSREFHATGEKIVQQTAYSIAIIQEIKESRQVGAALSRHTTAVQREPAKSRPLVLSGSE